MTSPHTFTIEVTAVPHREVDGTRRIRWQAEVEKAIASALLYEKGSFSAITRVLDPTRAS